MKKIILGLILGAGLLFGNQLSDSFVSSVNGTIAKCNDAQVYVSNGRYDTAISYLYKALELREETVRLAVEELAKNEPMHETIMLWHSVMTHFPIFNQICALALGANNKSVINECFANLDKIEDVDKIPYEDFKRELRKNFNPIDVLTEHMGVYYGNMGDVKKVGELAKYSLTNYPHESSGWYLTGKYLANQKYTKDNACFNVLATKKAYELGATQKEVKEVATTEHNLKGCKSLEEYAKLFLQNGI
ncbi:MAG: hypothetical protein IBX45_12155 [Campylobacterales bacterium]|nr:hypothetical protein [Campylobacterales bacterium]